MQLHNRTVRQDVRELGALLGDILKEQTSRRDFETVEDLRTTAIAYRDGEIENQRELHEILNTLSPEEESIVARAFTSYFELINLAEERERVRRIREGSHDGTLQGTPEEMVNKLTEADLTAEQAESLLEDICIEPTFTGHPTEARRKTVKTKLRSIGNHIETLDERRLTDKEQGHVERDINAEVTSLWQTPHVRTRQPEPEDEARNIQWYLHNPIYETIGEIYDELEDAMADAYGEEITVPSLIRFRSMAGGNRDGNPYMTPEVTESTLDRHQQLILDRYRKDLKELLGVLSQDGTRITAGEKFEKALSADRELLPGVADDAKDRYPGEPYRQKLVLMRERLNRVNDVRPGGYQGVEEFKEDLDTIAESLEQNGAQSVVEGHVNPLRRCAETFGFSLASVDLRDHASRHTEAVSALLEREGIDYADLSEPDRIETLTDAILQEDAIVDLEKTEDIPDEISDVCARFVRLADWHRQFGVESIRAYCISMVDRASHVLEVLFLADQADVVELPGHSGIDIVPIIETKEAMEGADEILETLLDNDAYSQAIEARDNVQEVSLGHADANQQNGFLTANWLIHQTQRNLYSCCDTHDVTLRMFHGRGGPISRGGGPMNAALRSLPIETITGQVRFTEGGESIAEKYGNRRIAERNIEQMINAQVRARKQSHHEETRPPKQEWLEAMEVMSSAARDAYRELVEADGFVEFFEEATPISVIEELDLGSRSYWEIGERSVEEIGGVPWNFAWTQSRYLLPNWYALASGIDAYLSEGGEMSVLKEMYEKWPFFKTTLDYAFLALGRADMEIATEYAQNAHPEYREKFVPILEEEYDRAVELSKEITERAHPIDRDWLRESLHRRNPYIKPLHLLQAHLLSQTHRTATEERTLRLTIKGIAAGLKNTG